MGWSMEGPVWNIFCRYSRACSRYCSRYCSTTGRYWRGQCGIYSVDILKHIVDIAVDIVVLLADIGGASVEYIL